MHHVLVFAVPAVSGIVSLIRSTRRAVREENERKAIERKNEREENERKAIERKNEREAILSAVRKIEERKAEKEREAAERAAAVRREKEREAQKEREEAERAAAQTAVRREEKREAEKEREEAERAASQTAVRREEEIEEFERAAAQTAVRKEKEREAEKERIAAGRAAAETAVRRQKERETEKEREAAERAAVRREKEREAAERAAAQTAVRKEEEREAAQTTAMRFGLALVFPYEELKKATDDFHSRVLGGGGFGKVYLGELWDGRLVAVKKLYDDSPKLQEQFFNEVAVLSRLHHPNLVALYGCTDARSPELLIVYEFVPNGTVADHLHGQRPTLAWDVRILIAIQTAEALAYLHSMEPPIIHRDVKTSNILLEDDFTVKVADLGLCRLLPWDNTHASTLPQGTVGYRDPEYEKCLKLTDRSDVYSFGVVLLELITGKEAVDVNRDLSEIYLTDMALNKFVNNELEQLVDPKLGYHSDPKIRKMVDSMAELARSCLQPRGNMRPHMVDVLRILKEIKCETTLRGETGHLREH